MVSNKQIFLVLIMHLAVPLFGWTNSLSIIKNDSVVDLLRIQGIDTILVYNWKEQDWAMKFPHKETTDYFWVKEGHYFYSKDERITFTENEEVAIKGVFDFFFEHTETIQNEKQCCIEILTTPGLDTTIDKNGVVQVIDSRQVKGTTALAIDESELRTFWVYIGDNSIKKEINSYYLIEKFNPKAQELLLQKQYQLVVLLEKLMVHMKQSE